MARAATGAQFSNGIFLTPTGPHIVLYKSPTHHMASNNLAAANSYDLPGVPGFHISPKMVLLFTALTGIMTLENREVMAALTSHLKPLVGSIFGQHRWSPLMFHFPLIRAAQRLM